METRKKSSFRNAEGQKSFQEVDEVISTAYASFVVAQFWPCSTQDILFYPPGAPAGVRALRQFRRVRLTFAQTRVFVPRHSLIR